MGGFIFLVVIIAIVILIIPIATLLKVSDTKTLLDHTNNTLKKVLEELEELKRKTVVEEKPVVVKKEVTPSVSTEIKPEVKPVEPVIVPPIVKEPIKEIIEEKPVPPVSKEPIKEESFVPLRPQLHEEVNEREFAEEPKDAWFRKNSDWERFIGENLANKIGIAVLVLGISFFVKYAIDKDWINETGRVLIGLVSGGILIGLAHYIRNNYRSFSSVLVGGGLTVFYFTIAFAFHEYHLIGQKAAFFIMVIISAFAVLLSLYYKRQELAILATIGGFITPFLVSTGENNYVVLFTYLCILNAGMMVLAWFKRWVAINIICLFFTMLIYGGWLLDHAVFNYRDPFPYRNALLFATLFYILFVIMSIINNLRMNRKFNAFDFILLLSTNFLYYAAGIVTLTYSSNENSQGIFTASLGLLNLGLAAVFYRKKNVDRSFVSLLIGLAITFISLTAPVHFEGNHITLFWAAEMVVLFWLYQRSGIKQLKAASLIIFLLMIISLLLTWTDVYFTLGDPIPIIVNKGFITTWVCAIAMYIYYGLLRKEQSEEYIGIVITSKAVKNILLVGSLALAYIAGVMEIHYQFNTRFSEPYLAVPYHEVYTFATAILLLQVFRRSDFFVLMKFIFTAFCLSMYLIHISQNYSLSLDLLSGNNGTLFIAHWVAAALLFWLLLDLVRYFVKLQNSKWESYKPAFTWTASASIVILLSIEMRHVILWVFMDMNEMDWWENLYFKPALTILWSVCSFAMMWLGMKYGFRTLRIISLTLFTITLVKLFSYDIVKIPPGGKIAAFILLGILLLTVSFMYQRLKKIIIDDKTGG